MKINGVFSAAILTAVLCISGNLLAYSGGDGNTVNPYQIANVADFNQLSAASAHWNKSFILTADINLTGLTFTKAPISPDTSDGTTGVFQGTQFTGVFDGSGHTISKLTINASAKDFIALFGYVGSGGNIKNLGVEDVNVTGRYMVSGLAGYNAGTLTACYATGSVTGIHDYVGGLVGWNISSITSCYAGGQVHGDWDIGGLVGYNYGTISNCYAAANTTASGYTVGGLVGYNGCDITSGTILNSHAAGTVTASFDSAGGLVGYNTDSSKISNCYATGAVSGDSKVGGLVGENDSNVAIWNCYATGQVTGTGTNYYAVGGLVGRNYYGIISSCYATGNINGIQEVGGLVGRNYSGSILNCYATGTATGSSTYVGGLVGYNYSVYGSPSCIISNSYAAGAASGTGGVGGLIGFNGYPSTTSYCYAAAAVSSAGTVGGLVGTNQYSTYTACFWNTDIRSNGVGYNFGGALTGMLGKNTTEMKTLATFTDAGWDFINETTNGTNDYWRMCVDSVNYPLLTWKYIPKGDFACPDGVGFDDLARLSGDWLMTYSAGLGLYGADANGDSIVNFADFAAMADNWLKSSI